jgi:putative drug exporter of the RND superfamily
MHRQIAGSLTGRVTKWVVLGFWVVLLGVAGPLAGKLADAQNNETSAWLPGDAESTKALDKLGAFVDPDEISTVIVYQRPEGITSEDKAKVSDDLKSFTGLDGVINDRVQGPIPSEDGKALEVVIPLDLGPNGWTKAADVVKDIRQTSQHGDEGLDAYVTGPGGMAADSADAFEGIDGTLLFATVGVVILILLFTYRSPTLWLLPVISAGVALATAQGVIYLLAKHAGLIVNGQSYGILTVLVFGAGTDYALLLVARYREELRRHHDRHEAMAVALHRAGPAIFASAGTVVLGMLCLLAAEMNSTQSLGPVAAIGVGTGLLVMVTLLPALLVICGRWMFWPMRPVEGSPEPTASGLWARVGRRIAVRPRTVWVTTTVILGIACFGIVQLNATGLTTEDSYTKTVESVTGEKVLASHYPAGASDPVQIVSDADHADDVVAAAQVDGVARIADPVVSNGTAFILATLDSAPDSDAAYDTVDAMRAAVHQVPDAAALVGGTTAINLDVQRASAHDSKVIIPIILIVVFLILALLLRALVAPLVLVATVVLSFGTALGISALVFRNVFDFAGADSSFPLFVFVFLVALGIDYNIFLMTRVREEALKYGTRRGALIGLGATGGVITSAGLVLAGTFAVLATLPLVFLAELGFAVALGVLLDTIVVRSVLVTALNLDIGRHMWWPSALGKKPDVDADALRGDRSVLVSD